MPLLAGAVDGSSFGSDEMECPRQPSATILHFQGERCVIAVCQRCDRTIDGLTLGSNSPFLSTSSADVCHRCRSVVAANNSTYGTSITSSSSSSICSRISGCTTDPSHRSAKVTAVNECSSTVGSECPTNMNRRSMCRQLPRSFCSAAVSNVATCGRLSSSSSSITTTCYIAFSLFAFVLSTVGAGDLDLDDSFHDTPPTPPPANVAVTHQSDTSKSPVRFPDKQFNATTELFGRQVTCGNVTDVGFVFPSETWSCYGIRVDNLPLRSCYSHGVGPHSKCGNEDGKNDFAAICRYMLQQHGITGDLKAALIVPDMHSDQIDAQEDGIEPGVSHLSRMVLLPNGTSYQWELYTKVSGRVKNLRCMLDG